MSPNLPKLMLVENDPYFIYILRRYGEESGFQVISIGGGDEAVSLARREQPVAILLEVDLPGMDVWDVLQGLRSEPATRHIPIILCLWSDHRVCSPPDPEEVCLKKPLQYEDFVTALQDAGAWPPRFPVKPYT